MARPGGGLSRTLVSLINGSALQSSCFVCVCAFFLLAPLKRETGDCCPVTDFPRQTRNKQTESQTNPPPYDVPFQGPGRRWRDSPRGGRRVPQIERPTNINRLVTGYCSRSIPGLSCEAAVPNASAGFGILDSGLRTVCL